jgi:hypothetical protein
VDVLAMSPEESPRSTQLEPESKRVVMIGKPKVTENLNMRNLHIVVRIKNKFKKKKRKHHAKTKNEIMS